MLVGFLFFSTDTRVGSRSERTYTHKIGFCLIRTDDAAFALTATPTASDVVMTTTYVNVRQREALLR